MEILHSEAFHIQSEAKYGLPNMQKIQGIVAKNIYPCVALMVLLVFYTCISHLEKVTPKAVSIHLEGALVQMKGNLLRNAHQKV